MTPPRVARLFLADRALFVGPLPPPAFHEHHAHQLAFALEGTLALRTPAGAWTGERGVAVAADERHELRARGPVGHFYLLPECTDGARVARWLAGRPALALPRDLCRQAAGALRGAWSASGDAAVMQAALERATRAVLARAPVETEPPDSGDDRVAETLERLARSDADLAELARAAALSPDRLRHLFRREVGIPVRRYRSWRRMLRALAHLGEGASVTEAAHAAGFADSAHFTRTFRQAFATSPAAFVHQSRILRSPDS